MLDNFRETAITWDKANRKVYEPLRASAGDNKGRKLSVQLVNDGVIEDLSGANLSLFWETRDKTNKGLDAFTAVDATKGEFEIYYTTGMLSNEGTLNANLVLVDASGRVVSEPFTINVFKGIDDDAIQSSDSFTALTEALAQVGTINNKADRAELLALESTFEQNKLSVDQQLQQTNTNVTDITPVNIRHFGAKSVYEEGYSNFDSTQAIQDAIDYALSSDAPSYVYIPNGYYHITDELIINSSIKIEGLYEKGNSGVNANGSHIHQKTAGKSIFKITGRSYGTEISKIRLSGGKAGIEIVYQTETDYFSEFVFEKIHFNGGFESAIILNGSIGRISTCDFSANDIGITLEEVGSVWFEHNNFWDAKKHHLLFKGSQTFVHFSNNWFEKNGEAGVLIQSPNALYGVTFTNCEFRSDNRQYVFLIDGNTNPFEKLSLKKLRITRCLLACIGGIDSVIRVKQANNKTAGNNNIVDIQDSVFSYVEEAGISTDFRWLRWNVSNVTQYKQWDAVINDKKVYSPEGVTNIPVTEYNFGETFTTNAGIKLLQYSGGSFEDGQIYRSSNGEIMYRDDTKSRKFILATDILVNRPTPTTWQELGQNFNNLVNALVESGIIR